MGISSLVCFILTNLLLTAPKFIGFCNDDLRTIEAGDNALKQSKNCSLGRMWQHETHSAPRNTYGEMIIDNKV